ncbi:Uncharacterised protein [Mycobacteroides abscessus subsp. abscessus]|nr:Uncharacterised protein [Mycobacteroides abscessus subsp. abscessus]
MQTDPEIHAADAMPLDVLSTRLRLAYWRPTRHWWAARTAIWLLPAGGLTFIGLTTPDPMPAIAFTIMGSFLGVQLVKPYQQVSRAMIEALNTMEHSHYSVTRGLWTLLRMTLFDQTMTNAWPENTPRWRRLFSNGWKRVGHMPITLPLERLRYRLRYRQCRYYFFWLDIGGPGTWVLNRGAPRLWPPRLWRARQRRVLGLLGRDIVRATGFLDSDESVRRVAASLQIEYRRAAAWPHYPRLTGWISTESFICYSFGHVDGSVESFVGQRLTTLGPAEAPRNLVRIRLHIEQPSKGMIWELAGLNYKDRITAFCTNQDSAVTQLHDEFAQKAAEPSFAANLFRTGMAWATDNADQAQRLSHDECAKQVAMLVDNNSVRQLYPPNPTR